MVLNSQKQKVSWYVGGGFFTFSCPAAFILQFQTVAAVRAVLPISAPRHIRHHQEDFLEARWRGFKDHCFSSAVINELYMTKTQQLFGQNCIKLTWRDMFNTIPQTYIIIVESSLENSK